MCNCDYISIHIHTHPRTYISTMRNPHELLYTHKHAHTRIYIWYIYTCICDYIYPYIYTHIHTHTYLPCGIHTNWYTHTNTHTHAYIYNTYIRVFTFIYIYTDLSCVLSYVPYERVPVTTVYWEARGKNKDSWILREEVILLRRTCSPRDCTLLKKRADRPHR